VYDCVSTATTDSVKLSVIAKPPTTSSVADTDSVSVGLAIKFPVCVSVAVAVSVSSPTAFSTDD